jgi:hypothetical protein
MINNHARQNSILSWLLGFFVMAKCATTFRFLYFMSMSVFWVVRPCRVAGRYQHFRGTHCLNSILKMETVYSSETVATTYKSTQHHNPGDQRWHLHCCENPQMQIHCSVERIGLLIRCLLWFGLVFWKIILSSILLCWKLVAVFIYLYPIWLLLCPLIRISFVYRALQNMYLPYVFAWRWRHSQPMKCDFY